MDSVIFYEEDIHGNKQYPKNANRDQVLRCEKDIYGNELYPKNLDQDEVLLKIDNKYRL